MINHIHNQNESNNAKSSIEILNENNKIPLENTNQNKKLWSKEEIKHLLYYAKEYNQSWSKISKHIKTKTPRQCSYYYKTLHYKNCLSKFRRVDDLHLIKQVKKYGEKWDLIQKTIPSFTKEQIHYRYKHYLRPKEIRAIKETRKRFNKFIDENNHLTEEYRQILITKFIFINSIMKKIVKIMLKENRRNNNKKNVNQKDIEGFDNKIMEVLKRMIWKSNYFLEKNQELWEDPRE